MTIAYRKKVLVICLANIRCQNKVILILLVYVVHTETLPGRVCETGNYIVFYYLLLFDVGILLDNKRILLVELNAVIVIDSLVLERGRLRYSRYQSLNRSSHRIIIHRQLVLNKWTRVWILAGLLALLLLFLGCILFTRLLLLPLAVVLRSLRLLLHARDIGVVFRGLALVT